MQDNESSTYRYFVSYVIPNGLAYGNSQINVPAPIRSVDDVRLVTRWLEEINGKSGVVILNFQLMSGPPVVDPSTEPRVNESFMQV
jgi:hypothetical protein